jgi:metal-responsive CopG/Arc/MetJ family transcriptional regulator
MVQLCTDINRKGDAIMARIDIRDLDDETLRQLDEQCQKYGINSRSDYIRMLIKLDIMTNIVQIINEQEDKSSGRKRTTGKDA